ncbi:hypothetical protein KG892_01045 [Vermiphilus pyriformis]|nr:MAG: hypothetical protein KG892_01045 [Vermiphilus pyriformis]
MKYTAFSCALLVLSIYNYTEGMEQKTFTNTYLSNAYNAPAHISSTKTASSNVQFTTDHAYATHKVTSQSNEAGYPLATYKGTSNEGRLVQDAQIAKQTMINAVCYNINNTPVLDRLTSLYQIFSLELYDLNMQQNIMQFAVDTGNIFFDEQGNPTPFIIDSNDQEIVDTAFVNSSQIMCENSRDYALFLLSIKNKGQGSSLNHVINSRLSQNEGFLTRCMTNEYTKLLTEGAIFLTNIPNDFVNAFKPSLRDRFEVLKSRVYSSPLSQFGIKINNLCVKGQYRDALTLSRTSGFSKYLPAIDRDLSQKIANQMFERHKNLGILPDRATSQVLTKSPQQTDNQKNPYVVELLSQEQATQLQAYCNQRIDSFVTDNPTLLIHPENNARIRAIDQTLEKPHAIIDRTYAITDKNIQTLENYGLSANSVERIQGNALAQQLHTEAVSLVNWSDHILEHTKTSEKFAPISTILDRSISGAALAIHLNQKGEFLKSLYLLDFSRSINNIGSIVYNYAHTSELIKKPELFPTSIPSFLVKQVNESTYNLFKNTSVLESFPHTLLHSADPVLDKIYEPTRSAIQEYQELVHYADAQQKQLMIDRVVTTTHITLTALAKDKPVVAMDFISNIAAGIVVGTGEGIVDVARCIPDLFKIGWQALKLAAKGTQLAIIHLPEIPNDIYIAGQALATLAINTKTVGQELAQATAYYWENPSEIQNKLQELRDKRDIYINQAKSLIKIAKDYAIEALKNPESYYTATRLGIRIGINLVIGKVATKGTQVLLGSLRCLQASSARRIIYTVDGLEVIAQDAKALLPVEVALISQPPEHTIKVMSDFRTGISRVVPKNLSDINKPIANPARIERQCNTIKAALKVTEKYVKQFEKTYHSADIQEAINVIEKDWKYILNDHTPEFFEDVVKFFQKVNNDPRLARFKYSDSGSITLKHIIEEAIPALYAQERNIVPIFFRRDATSEHLKKFDYTELWGQKWDIKTPIVTYSKYGKCEFQVAEFVRDLQKDIALGEKILLNITHLKSQETKSIANAINNMFSPYEIGNIFIIHQKNTNLCGKLSHLKDYLCY